MVAYPPFVSQGCIKRTNKQANTFPLLIFFRPCKGIFFVHGFLTVLAVEVLRKF